MKENMDQSLAQRRGNGAETSPAKGLIEFALELPD